MKALLCVALSCVGLCAQPKPEFSGFWELRFDSRNVPAASLTAAATAAAAQQAAHDMHAIRWCYKMGVPYLMELSPIDIVQNTNGKEIAITFPYRGPSRHIYTDGRKPVDHEIFDPASNGDSVGRWEGDTLVVDTVGFSDEGVTRIPGGGRRTPKSHLVERVRLVNGGRQLSVVSTWQDADVFTKPHTYEFRYYRAPKTTEAREYNCDASDEQRAKFLMGAPGAN
jgi:hypothetical protein